MEQMDQVVYDESQIQVLEGLEPVRKRPGMYIGTTSIRGLHHLVYEIVDNSIDEATIGICDTINITIEKNNYVTVFDNGRGIPSGLHPTMKKSTLEVILTTLHAGGKFGQSGYNQSGGLHGVGSSVVNALSSHMIATVKRDGNIYQQEYQIGKPLYETKVIGKTEEHGTTISFLADNTIFETTTYKYSTLTNRLRELAYLNKGIKIIFEDKREGKEQVNEYHFEGGIKEYIEYINKDKDNLDNNIIYIEKEAIVPENKYNMEIAFQYTNEYQSNLYSYVNNINTIDGGTHVNGFRNAILKVFNDYSEKNNLIKEKFIIEDIIQGITCVISVKLNEPEFEGQTKGKLGTSSIKKFVEDNVKDYLEIYFIENPTIVQQWIDKAITNQKIRLATKKAKENAKKRNSKTVILSGKLADCSSKDISENEMIVVEGDSGGGSAKLGRNRKIQAIMPSKGKIMNVEKKKIDKVLDSEEIVKVCNALGIDIEGEYDESKLRYGKCIILSDADKLICPLYEQLYSDNFVNCWEFLRV